MTDPSRRIGDYEVLAILGSGGMGKVFKVRNVISDRIEAMKILLPDLAGRQDLVDRFLREIKVLASLDHPNIAQLRTALTIANQLVMVMEYVDGTTLAARLEQGPIPPEEASRYISQILSALSYAHGRNVIHRDIKPSNMMLTPSGTVKLMDFGIARNSGDASMTTTGTTVGSLYYMSPEQVKGGTVDARSDLYSLGVSFYEMVTGERPFKADSDYSLMTAQLQERPKPPSALRPELPVELNGIILHSMAKDPEGRFQSADEFRQALDSIRQGMPAVTPSVVSEPVSSSPLATSVFSGTPAPQTPPLTLQSPPQARMQTAVAPSVMESAKPGKGRGLYMALGAVIVLVVLVLAGLSFPRWLKTRAAEQKQSADQSSSSQSATQNSAGAASSSTTPDANGSTTPDSGASGSGTTSGSSGTPDSTKPSDASGQPPADSGAGAGSAATTGGAASSAGSTSGGAASSDNTTMASGSTPTATSSKGKSSSGKKGKAKANTGSIASPTDQANTTVQGDQNYAGSGSVSKGEPIEEVEQDVDQASSRANAASESLDNMRRQLSGQGLSLRGDIASSQELMKANLDKAHQALQNGDTKNARRYLGMAQAQIEKIEKFLGH